MLGILLLGPVPAAAAKPSVSLTFAAAEANARTFQPLRLTTDLPGPPRAVVVRLVLPRGAYTVRPVDRIDVGGGKPRTYIFNIFIPDGEAAGDFVVTGEVRDDSRVWPLRASLRIRAAPKVRVMERADDPIIVASDQVATDQLTVLNTGNTPLHVAFTLQPNPDLQATLDPAEITLEPGTNGAVRVTARPTTAIGTLFETSLFANVEAKRDQFVQRDTVGFNFGFVPVNPDPGPLFAQLQGEMIPGWLLDDNSGAHAGFAGRFALAGDLTPKTRLELSGADGRASAGGSHVGLADRDFARVALQGDWGQAAGGLVSPPTFGLIEPSTQGRGGLAELARGSWRLAAFGTRDTYPGFARESYGLQMRQPDGPWEFGALAQSNESAGTPDTNRVGGYAQWRWVGAGLDSTTEAAASRADSEGADVRFAAEERVSWRQEHLSFDGTLQLMQPDFTLAGRSSRESNATLTWQNEIWQWYGRWLDSKDDGSLETEQQRRRDAGEVALAPAIVELTTQDTSRRIDWEFGANRDTALGQFGFSAAYTDYSTALDPHSDYREASATLGWTRSQIGKFAEVGVTGGREETDTATTDFAELNLNFSGQWRKAVTYSLSVRHDWNWNGFSTGLRRPGTYGQFSLNWQPRPTGWRVEAGFNLYDYDGLPSSTYTYVVVEMPLSRRFNLGAEINTESNGGPRNAWVFLRVPLALSMPWRPTRGALVGSMRDAHGAPLPGAFATLGDRRAITTSDGGFVLPAMPPGRYPLSWRMPGGWTEGSDWPREVELHAGEREFIDLSAQQLAVLQGTITVNSDVPGAAPRKPDGAVRATNVNGKSFETTVTAGEFRIGLPPGRYQIQFQGAETDAVTAQLQTTAIIDSESSEVSVQLAATERRRKMRQTLFIEKQP